MTSTFSETKTADGYILQFKDTEGRKNDITVNDTEYLLLLYHFEREVKIAPTVKQIEDWYYQGDEPNPHDAIGVTNADITKTISDAFDYFANELD